jgi:hypothetical protein
MVEHQVCPYLARLRNAVQVESTCLGRKGSLDDRKDFPLIHVLREQSCRDQPIEQLLGISSLTDKGA